MIHTYTISDTYTLHVVYGNGGKLLINEEEHRYDQRRKKTSTTSINFGRSAC